MFCLVTAGVLTFDKGGRVVKANFKVCDFKVEK